MSSENAKKKAENTQDGTDTPDKETKEEEKKVELSEQDKRIKKNYEDYYSVVESHAKDEFRTLIKNDETTVPLRAMTPLRELFNEPISQSDLNKLKHIKCVESIEYSNTFNPVTPQRKMQGDLFYITVRVLESPNVEQCITASVNGFFRNDSSERHSFNPLPCSKASPCFSYTLAGCLNQLSPSFSKNLQTYIGSIL
jgi:hypothetical protein